MKINKKSWHYRLAFNKFYGADYFTNENNIHSICQYFLLVFRGLCVALFYTLITSGIVLTPIMLYNEIIISDINNVYLMILTSMVVLFGVMGYVFLIAAGASIIGIGIIIFMSFINFTRFIITCKKYFKFNIRLKCSKIDFI